MKIKLLAMKDEQNNETDEYLVRVRAQVMMRDDSSGGWVPMGGGGLSDVAVHKRPIINHTPNPPPDVPGTADHDRELALALALQYEYLIFGQRISDKKMVFSCIIKRDFEYNKVMPTFHHWKTGDSKYGLAFQAAADARAFDKGVRTAVEELLEALPRPYWQNGPGNLDVETNSAPLASGPSRFLLLLQLKQFQHQYRAVDLLAAALYPPPVPTTRPFVMGMEGLSELSAPPNIYQPDDDDDVFMALDLPVERGDSRSSSDSSARGTGNSRHPTPPSEHPQQQYTHPHATHHHMHRISYFPRHQPPPNGYDTDKQSGTSSQLWLRTTNTEGKTTSPDKEIQGSGGAPMGTDNYSYVQLTAVHEYTYPTMEEQKGGLRGLSARRESSDSFKKLSGSGGVIHEPLSPSQPPLPVKTSGRKKSRFGESPQKTKSCKYCQKPFTLDVNPTGSCLFAPDKMGKFVDTVSCIEAARCMTYHCSSDLEGNLEQETCKCGMPGQEGCCLRWLGLGLLSLFVPCLCLYPPLKACHWCGRQCGICGGRHAELRRFE